ncbi:MAG: aromatic prenyltransferase [Pseudonocardiaceae bacterium]
MITYDYGEDILMAMNRLSSDRFLEDVRTTAAAIGAPFSERATRRILDVYEKNFSTGAVLWKTTSRPGDSLSYRFYSRDRTDTLDLAVRAGLLDPETPLAPLVTSWSSLNGGSANQSCDFDAGTGLAKTWVFLGETLSLDEVLGVDLVPETLRRHAPVFRQQGLEHVRFMAVDYRYNTVNFYFRVRGPFSRAQHVGITRIVQGSPPPEVLTVEIGELLPKNDYLTAVTVSVDSGLLERAAFYAAQIPKGKFPVVGERLSLFFSQAPSHDATDVNIVAWSFGGHAGSYIKGERSWYGDLASLFKEWKVLASGSEQKDPVLRPTTAATI